jgi:predicted DCC family thiol-disulfide oxidoreductase YuxK
MAQATAQQQPGVAPFRRLVLFDGACVFCDGAVRWLAGRDPEGRLHFATLQGETAAALRARHPEIPRELDTMAYVEADADGERVFLRWEALVRTCRALSRPPPGLRFWAHLPRALGELAYRLFARLRYRLFGRMDRCPLPPAELRARFLD